MRKTLVAVISISWKGLGLVIHTQAGAGGRTGGRAVSFRRGGDDKQTTDCSTHLQVGWLAGLNLEKRWHSNGKRRPQRRLTIGTDGGIQPARPTVDQGLGCRGPFPDHVQVLPFPRHVALVVCLYNLVHCKREKGLTTTLGGGIKPAVCNRAVAMQTQ